MVNAGMLRAVVVEDNAIEQEYLRRLLDEVDDVQVISIETDKPKGVIIHTAATNYTARQNLGAIQDRLARLPNFLRTHRGYLVNLDWVTRIEAWNNNSYRIVFRNFSGEAFLSRNCLTEFRKRLEASSSISGQ